MNALKRYLRIMNPPTEISKKDIIRVALHRMGDGNNVWTYLSRLGIVRPPQRKFTFTLVVEARDGDTPDTWNTGNLGRVMYNGMRNTSIAEVQETTEEQKEDPNEGTVSVADFLDFARHVKKSEGYCPEFWNVVERELGVTRPAPPAVKVSFVLQPSHFENADIDPDQELSLGVLRSVLEDSGSVDNYEVTPVNA